ncbi:MAG: hypothetical protein AAB724_03410 [Patescibacteria group bacterium]
MLQINPKIKLEKTSAYLKWKITSIIIVGFMVASIIFSSYFIYLNIYRTLEDANTVVLLNTVASIDAINMPAYEKAESFLELKQSPVSVPKNIRNVFSYSSSASSHASSSTNN